MYNFETSIAYTQKCVDLDHRDVEFSKLGNYAMYL
jgi:hypothetical protein